MKKIISVLMITTLLVMAMAQSVLADESIIITKQSDVPTGDVRYEGTTEAGGIKAVRPDPMIENNDITVNGNIEISITGISGGYSDLPQIIGVQNDSTFTVNTKSITINDNTDNCEAIGVDQQQGTTVVDGTIDSDDYGIQYIGGIIVCTGNVHGDGAAMTITGTPATDKIVVYGLESGTAGIIAGDDENDTKLKTLVNYIIKRNDTYGAISSLSGTTTVQGYDTAHAGETIQILVNDGYTLGSTVQVVSLGNNQYSVTVPRTGGVTLEAILKIIAQTGGNNRSSASAGRVYTDEQLQELARKYGAILVKNKEDIVNALSGGTPRIPLLFTQSAIESIDFVNEYGSLMKECKIMLVTDTGNITSSTYDAEMGLQLRSLGNPFIESSKQIVNSPFSNEAVSTNLIASERMTLQFQEASCELPVSSLTPLKSKTSLTASAQQTLGESNSTSIYFTNVRPVGVLINGKAIEEAEVTNGPNAFQYELPTSSLTIGITNF